MVYHLIGCIHNDPQGEGRVTRALSTLQPDLITLEWKGEEAHPLRKTRVFQTALARYNEIARAAVEACGYNPHAYDQITQLAYDWGPEVRGTLAWAKSHGVTVVPTEEPTQGDDYDRRLVKDPEKEAAIFVQWIHEWRDRGEEYNPLVFFPPNHNDGYDLLEFHLAGRLTDLVDEDVDRYRRDGVLNYLRYNFERAAVLSALALPHSTMVHIGGAWHIADAGHLEPPTLFQVLKRERPEVDVIRHSLRQF